MSDRSERLASLRREPPPFRRVQIIRTEELSPRLRRLTFAGDELEGLEIEAPAASVRLLIPTSEEFVIPTWEGNEFLLPDGHRPLIRTFTPRHLRRDPAELDLDVVLHGDDGASGWAAAAEVGDRAAVSGPGRGYEIDPDSDPLILLGDETAIPAIAQLLEAVPGDTPVVGHIEVAQADARCALPEHPSATVTWHDLPEHEAPGRALLGAIAAETLEPAPRVWAAGEAAGVQQIRKHLAERDIDRSRTTVRGYWKVGRAGPG